MTVGSMRSCSRKMIHLPPTSPKSTCLNNALRNLLHISSKFKNHKVIGYFVLVTFNCLHFRNWWSRRWEHSVILTSHR